MSTAESPALQCWAQGQADRGLVDGGPAVSAANSQYPQTSWRQRLHTIIFESDTRAGKAFDLLLLLSIVASVLVVMLDSVAAIRATYGPLLTGLEWAFTLLFTVEYILRLVSVRRPLAYVGTFFGVVDLLAIIPTYLSLIFPGTQYLLVVRVLRLLRIFRVLKLAEYLHEGRTLSRALAASRRKISVFLLTVITVVIVVGAVMYVVEGPASGFTSIPTSIYWAVVTLTTVGYGDIAPQTALGKLFAVLVMLLGYGIIAVPTGIVTMELQRAARPLSGQACPSCGLEGHDVDARFCKRCGQAL
jgi:voltage-gated potassium channel